MVARVPRPNANSVGFCLSTLTASSPICAFQCGDPLCVNSTMSSVAEAIPGAAKANATVSVKALNMSPQDMRLNKALPGWNRVSAPDDLARQLTQYQQKVRYVLAVNVINAEGPIRV